MSPRRRAARPDCSARRLRAEYPCPPAHRNSSPAAPSAIRSSFRQRGQFKVSGSLLPLPLKGNNLVLTGHGSASGLSVGGSQMFAERPEADLDLLDFPLEAAGELGPAVPAGLVDDLPQEHGFLLPDLEDGAKSAVDGVGLGLEELAHREEMAVPAVERQLGSPRQEREGMPAVRALDPEGDVRRSDAGFH